MFAQGQQLATYGFQCWGIEFRGQGSLPAPPGCLLELYLNDVYTIVEALGLQGGDAATTMYCNLAPKRPPDPNFKEAYVVYVTLRDM